MKQIFEVPSKVKFIKSNPHLIESTSLNVSRDIKDSAFK